MIKYNIYPGAEHSRFGHSLGVMHLVTKAFQSAIKGYEDNFEPAKVAQYEQILRLIALLHDIGHAPFSHASEAVFPQGMEHEDFTVKIIIETEIADIISKIGKEFRLKYGEEYDISPKLICDIYMGKVAGPNSEYSFTICYTNHIPRLAIENGGLQVFEEFVLARYFMFIQVYFHRTRRYFDIMLGRALTEILPEGTYPIDIKEYLKWDDNRVFQLMKENVEENEACKNIINRYVYPRVFHTKTHPLEADEREFNRNYKELVKKVGEENLIIDKSAGKMPHRIPKRSEIENEKTIIIFDKTIERKTTIPEQSDIIRNLTEKINLMRIYCHPDKVKIAIDLMKSYNE